MKNRVFVMSHAAIFAAITLGCLVAALSGCSKSDPLDPKNPVTLYLWHPYEQRMRVNIDELITEFNSTVGAARGIIVRDSFVAETEVINSALISAADGIPGAPALPDIAVVYPNIAITLANKGLLMDFSAQFSEDELSHYVKDFLEEGKIGGTLFVLPVAKSTEVMFVNAAIFNRFAAGVEGVSLSRLASFEGLLWTAQKYYEWSGGKSFMYYTDLFNYSLTAFNQHGGNFLEDDKLNLSSPIFHKVWDGYFPRAVQGGLAIFDSYGSHLMATGETVAILDTTASVAFLSNTVIYADNIEERYELVILPYPVFEGGQKASVQQGAGMCVIKSDAKKEYAAGVFLKWFTQPEQNLRFTVSLGYMPVTTDAFSEFMENPRTYIKGDTVMDNNARKLVDVVSDMQKNYRFHYPPVFDLTAEMRWSYARQLRTAAQNARNNYLGGASYEAVSIDAMEQFIGNR